MQEQFGNISAAPGALKPTEDPARPTITADVTRGVERLLVDIGVSPLAEFRLASGRRVDVAGLDGKGRIAFVEVKSSREDFDADQKWPEYLSYCDMFYFAVAESFPIDLLPQDQGLIVADRFGGAVVRPPAPQQVAPARRKAVTLRFARAAALRLSGTAMSDGAW